MFPVEFEAMGIKDSMTKFVPKSSNIIQLSSQDDRRETEDTSTSYSRGNGGADEF